MKKIVSSATMLFAALVLILGSATSAKAYDCGTAVDTLCKSFNAMKTQVNAINSLDGFDNLDFDAAIDRSGVGDIPDSCMSHVMTQAEKTKLKNAFNGLMDAMINKLYSLGGGMITKAEVSAQFNPMKNTFAKAVDSAKTLGDVVYSMENLW